MFGAMSIVVFSENLVENYTQGYNSTMILLQAGDATNYQLSPITTCENNA